MARVPASWLLRIVIGLIPPLVAMSGCSTDPDPPPPPPPPTVAQVVVTPSSDTVLVMETLSLSVSVRDQAGAPITGRTVSWESSAPTVAAVDANGVVAAVSRGDATILARVDGVTGTVALTVRDPYRHIEIDRRFPSVFADDTIRLEIVAVDSAYGRHTISRAIWLPADPLVAQVDSAGIARGGQVGRTYLRARVGTSVDSTELAVVPKRIRANREVAYFRYPGVPGGPTIDEIWLHDGTSERRISTEGRKPRSYSWSPDGSLLAIVYWISASGQSPLTEVIDVDAGTRRSFALSADYVSISPDNQRLALRWFVNGAWIVTTSTLDGTILRQFDEIPGEVFNLIWAPDGRRLAFLRLITPTNVELWWMDANLEYPKQLVSKTLVRNPEWSPDGKHIAFDDGDRVWLVDAELGTVRSLSPLGVLGKPRWSPAGDAILYGVYGSVRVVRLDGSLIGNIPTNVNSLGGDFGTFSSDGTKVAVAGRKDGPQVMTADLDGGAQHFIGPVNTWSPWWRP